MGETTIVSPIKIILIGAKIFLFVFLNNKKEKYMQVNRLNSSENSFQNPSFGKVLKFENGFQKYLEKINPSNDLRYANKLKAYADFLDVFEKSKPIKDYVAKHDVNIKFALDSHDSNPMVEITDTSLHPRLSRNDVLLVMGEETWHADKFTSSFRSLAQKIRELPMNALEERLKGFQAQAEKETKRLFENNRYESHITNLISDENSRIQKSLDEINKW